MEDDEVEKTAKSRQEDADDEREDESVMAEALGLLAGGFYPL